MGPGKYLITPTLVLCLVATVYCTSLKKPANKEELKAIENGEANPESTSVSAISTQSEHPIDLTSGLSDSVPKNSSSIRAKKHHKKSHRFKHRRFGHHKRRSHGKEYRRKHPSREDDGQVKELKTDIKSISQSVNGTLPSEPKHKTTLRRSKSHRRKSKRHHHKLHGRKVDPTKSNQEEPVNETKHDEKTK